MVYAWICICLLHVIHIGAVTIGSDSAVELFMVQQLLDDTDRIAGFAALKAGFALNGVSVTALFDSFFPVEGNIGLADGTLSLQKDLVLFNSAAITSMGSVVGNAHMVEFSSTLTDITGSFGTQYVWNDVTLFLNNDINLHTVDVVFTGSSVIHGHGNTLTLDAVSQLHVGVDAQLILKNITIAGVNTSSFGCLDSTSELVLKKALLLLDGTFTFSVGSLMIHNDVYVSGDGHTFEYTSSNKSVVMSRSSLVFNPGITFFYNAGLKELVRLSDETAIIHFNKALLHASAVGFQLTQGTVMIEDECMFDSDGLSSVSGITFGDGIIAANNMNIHILPESGIVHRSGYVSYNNV